MYEDANCTLLGISFDTPADNKAFVDKFDFPFRLLSDPDKAVGAVYGAVREAGEPYGDFSKRVSYLIDPQGTVAKAYTVSDPSGHAAEVLADLVALQQ